MLKFLRPRFVSACIGFGLENRERFRLAGEHMVDALALASQTVPTSQYRLECAAFNQSQKPPEEWAFSRAL